MLKEKELAGKKAGSLIKEFRRIRGLTQKDLAEMVGLQRSTIAQIEGGTLPVSHKAVSKISVALGMGTLLEGKRPIKEEQEEKINDVVSRFSLLAHRNFVLAQDFLRIAEQARDAEEDGDRIMFHLVEERRRYFCSLYPGVLTGTISLRSFSTIETWSGLLDLAEESILATSCLKPETWWNTPVGRYYHVVNIEKMKKKRKSSKEFEVQRIFVFENPEECKQVKDLIEEQLTEGIKVWIGYKLSPGIAHDFYLIDGKYVAWLDVRDRETIETTRLSNDFYEILRAQRLFGSMKSQCQEISDKEEFEEFCREKAE